MGKWHKQPKQPCRVDANGVKRFKKNAIVRYLLDSGDIDMNDLANLPFSIEDRRQFAQLIGYSVNGYNELSYTDGPKNEESVLRYVGEMGDYPWNK